MRLLLWQLELSGCNRALNLSWLYCSQALLARKKKKRSQHAFRVSYIKGKSPQMRRNLWFQRAATLGFCSAHAVLFWRNSAFCRELMDAPHSLWGWASTPCKLHDHPMMKEGSQSGQKWAAEAEVQAPALLDPLGLSSTPGTCVLKASTCPKTECVWGLHCSALLSCRCEFGFLREGKLF